MAKFKVGQTVYIHGQNKFGTIAKVDKNGLPIEIKVDGQIIETVGLILEVVSLFKLIWASIKSLFKKRHETA